MAGVGRKSDFGKPEFTDAEVENRLDTVDPFVDENLTYEDNVQRLMACGLSENMAMKCVDMAIIRGKKGIKRRQEMLRETTEFRQEIGDIESCKPNDESCAPARKDTK
jgi:uncharacterized protein YoaH (UPF0181 family)